MWAGRCIPFGSAVAACVLPVAAAAALIAAIDALRRARRDKGENLMSVGASLRHKHSLRLPARDCLAFSLSLSLFSLSLCTLSSHISILQFEKHPIRVACLLALFYSCLSTG